MALTKKSFKDIITFTRSTTALYPSGESQKAEQNLLRYSQEFDRSTHWSAARVTVTGDQNTAPDGTVTADEIVETTDTGNHILASHNVTNLFSVVSGDAYSAAVSIAKGDGASASDWIQLAFLNVLTGDTDYANFDINSGATGNSSGLTADIDPEENGYWRCKISAIANQTSGSGRFFIIGLQADTAARAPSYAGSTDANVFIWGAQVENR